LSLQITINLTEGALLILFPICGRKIAGLGSQGLNTTTLDLSSQSGAYELSATATFFTQDDCL